MTKESYLLWISLTSEMVYTNVQNDFQMCSTLETYMQLWVDFLRNERLAIFQGWGEFWSGDTFPSGLAVALRNIFCQTPLEPWNQCLTESNPFQEGWRGGPGAQQEGLLITRVEKRPSDRDGGREGPEHNYKLKKLEANFQS